MAMSTAYVVEFDAPSLARIARIAESSAIMAAQYRLAMGACVTQVKTRAKLNAPVGVYPGDKARRTGGSLRRSIKGIVRSPLVGEVSTGKEIPYAKRREFGYDRQTDTLGRYYPMDPIDFEKRSHMFYMKHALEESLAFIESAFASAARVSIQQMSIP